MSILIRGASLPKSCNKCKLDLRTDICQAFCEWNAEHPYSIRATDRLPDCPLSEVPEPCEDAVSRNLVLTEVKSGMMRTIDGENWKRVSDNVRDIKAIPSVTPKQRTGKWIRDGHHIRCDQCGMYMCDTDREGDRIPTEFCPHCGADMREVTI